MNIINSNAPINDNNNIFSKIKSAFLKKFATIKRFLSVKRYTRSYNLQEAAANDPKINFPRKEKLHETIPEHVDLVEDIKPNIVENLYHYKKHSTDNENIQLRAKREDFILGKGGFGEVRLAAIKSKNPEKNISPLLIRKKFIRNPSANKNALEEAKEEHIKNKEYGVYSVADFNNEAIINKYKGESFSKVIKAAFETTHDSIKPKPLSNEVKEHFCRELLENIKNLHDQGIMHQDIKPDNILVDAKGKLSIIDLATATQNGSKKQDYKHKYSFVGTTPEYMAPEINTADTVGLTQYYDCWAVGVVIYELYTEKSLITECLGYNEHGNLCCDYNALATVKDKGLLNNVQDNRNIPENIKKLLHSLLKINPTERPTMKQALELLDRNKLDISTMSDLQLNVAHDKKFKQIVELELTLKNAIEKDDLAEIKKLSEKIADEKKSLAPLQKEINKRKQT